MPEKSAAKIESNRVKSRGLGKLQFFCQMCSKQCRDENGFKCHCRSESHIRQMALFSQNSEKFMDSFSSGFEKTFLELLSRRFGTRRVHANIVYNEYIQDKLHTHMNSTMWTTLTDFVKYLGRTGKCVIDEDAEKGWHVTWINRDPETVRRHAEAARRKERELDDEGRFEAEIAAIAEAAARRAAAEGGLPPATDDSDEEREGGDGGRAGGGRDAHAIVLGQARLAAGGGALQVKLSLGGLSRGAVAGAAPLSGGQKRPRPPEEEEEEAGSSAGPTRAPLASPAVVGPVLPPTKPQSNLDRLVEETEAARGARRSAGAGAAQAAPRPPAPLPAAATDDWLAPGLVVRVVHRTVGGGAYFKAKGVVVKVVDTYGAHVRLLEGGAVLSLDVADLETTVPGVGGSVRILYGVHRGALGRVRALDSAECSAEVELLGEGAGGRVVRGLDYEHVCRVEGV